MKNNCDDLFPCNSPQTMKFQMESQQKTRKNNKGSSLNCKNNKKHFLKVKVITSLQIVLLFSLKMRCGTHSKHFPRYQIRIRPLRHITEDMKISILPTVQIRLMQKSPATATKARNCGTQQIRRLYLTKEKLANKAFYKQLNYCQNYSAPRSVNSTKDRNVLT